MFDGQSTRWWRAVGGGPFPAQSWTVQDGCLKALVHKPDFQDIRTEADFGDFELTFEWKIAPGGNSGLKYLIHREDVWQPKGATEGRHARGRGFEFQVADDAVMPKPEEQSGAMYAFLAPTRHTAKPVGEFNHARILRRGAAIEHWLNGDRVLDVRLDAPAIIERMKQRKVPTEIPARTPIVLQNHSSEAWFRHLQIREL